MLKNLNQQFRYSRGYTLLELLVVMSILVLIMLSASALFLSSTLGNTRTVRTQIVKNEGKFALTQIEFILRNAVQIIPNSQGQTCQTGMSELYVLSYDNKLTRLLKETDTSDSKSKIASNSGVYLTSGSVNITSGPTFDCQESSDKTTQFVTVTFTLSKGNATTDQTKEIISETFKTSASIRSF